MGMTMEFEMTKHHVARTARPDAETYDKIHLLKSALALRATYQVRLLLFRAVQEGRKLVLNVKKECVFHDDLKSLVKEHRKSIEVVRR
jgi:hypothetical protein